MIFAATENGEMAMGKLKHCPFCGGKAKISVREATYGACGAQIRCKDCGARTRYYSTHEMITEGKTISTPLTDESKRRGISNAIIAWNRRDDNAAD